MTMTGENDVHVLEQALSGKPEALPPLVDRWTPVIQSRVVRVLRRSGYINDARTHQEIEEFVQQVFVSLLEGQGKALRAWQPERGLSLDNWVGLLAERKVLSLVRTRKRNPWTEEPVVADALDRSSDHPDPEAEALSRDALGRLLDRLKIRLSPLGWRLFEILYLEEQSVAAAADQCGLTMAAAYAWRSRLRRTATELHADLMSKAATRPRNPPMK